MTKLDARISLPAALLADQTREAMVMTLMDGRAYTSKELAFLHPEHCGGHSHNE